VRARVCMCMCRCVARRLLCAHTLRAAPPHTITNRLTMTTPQAMRTPAAPAPSSSSSTPCAVRAPALVHASCTRCCALTLTYVASRRLQARTPTWST
jgi:hypothetical protein